MSTLLYIINFVALMAIWFAASVYYETKHYATDGNHDY